MISPVLVVEDDADIRESLQLVLQEAGYPVMLAEHGAQALEALELMTGAAREPQSIILDLWMPVMDGESFLEELTRQRRSDLTQRVIVTSADRTAKQRVARFGVERVLTKPFDLSDLLDAIGSQRLAAAR